MSLFSSPPFLPRFPHASSPTIGNELAPFFRMIEDLTDTTRAFDHFSAPARIRSFQPRFDIREVGSNYELRGELPGVDGKDLEVEFTDAQTLVIRGRTESEMTSGTPPAQVAQAIGAAEPTTSTTNAVADNSDAASTHSASSYQRPTVEDEGDRASTPGQDTPAESTTSEAPQHSQQTTQTVATTQTAVATQAETTQPQSNIPRYWVSERSTGSFQRVFNFPSRVNQEGVTASLKNGILSIVVPKAVAPGTRRIVVQ